MRKAFTLIELLVVIAIIAILAAILFPVFAQAKLAAKKTAGISQMKQIGTALQIYASDYDDGTPTWNTCLATYPTTARAAACPLGLFDATYHWDAMLMPYVKNGRPELRQWSGLWRSPNAEYAETVGRSLGINQLAMWDITQTDASGSPAQDPVSNVNNGAYYWLNMGQISEVSSTVFVGDSGVAGRLDPTYFLNSFRDNWITPLRPLQWAAPWRYGREGANYVRYDSSTRYERGDTMYPNPGRTFGSLTGWPAAVRANLFCQAARWQAPRDDQKDALRAVAATIGVPCQN